MTANTPGSRGSSKIATILMLLWLAFVIWTIVRLFGNLFGLFEAQGDYALVLAFGGLFFNLWGLAASFGFMAIAVDLFAWVNARRFVAGGLTLAVMLGAMWGGLIHEAVAAAIGLLGPQFAVAGGALPLWAMLLAIGGLFVIAPIVLVAIGAAAIASVAATALALFAFLVAIPSILFRQLLEFDNAVTRYKYEARGLAGYIVRFMHWLRNEPLPESLPDESRGARFATEAEAIERHNADSAKPGAMDFGHWPAQKIPLTLHTDKHVLIMASTRSGKGVSLIIPHLLGYEGSAFVLDPKGENARATARRRGELNDKVHVLDPFGLTGLPKARFNPLSRFTPQNMEAESKALAAALFLVGDRERDHWTASGQQLLAAIILFVIVCKAIPPEKKDLPAVRRLLLGNLRPTLGAMAKMDEADGLLRDLAMSFLETPEKEFGSIVSTAQRQTEILDNPQIVACLSATGPGQEVDFKDWRRGTMTVYLCLSAPKFPVFNRWLRLVLTSALDEMTDTLAPPPVPVCFMLDELATLGHLQAVENAVGLAAGYGIQLVNVFQDVAQMRDLYKGRWASFIGNAGVRALFNLDDYDTAKYWSDFIGGTVVATASRQEDAFGLSSGQNVGEAVRPLIPPDKIMMDFASGKMLVLAQGLRPVITDRVAYWNDPELNGLWDDPRQPPTSPQTALETQNPAQIEGYSAGAAFRW